MRSLKRARKAVVFASIAITGNQNALSDAGVAASMARSCAEGAWMNVRINLKDLKNDELRQNMQKKLIISWKKYVRKPKRISISSKKNFDRAYCTNEQTPKNIFHIFKSMQ